MYTTTDKRIAGLDYTVIGLTSRQFDKMMCEKFPKLFRRRDMPMDTTSMCWGFEINKGWYPLLYTLCIQVQEICDAFGIQIEFEQIKEKFGSLRAYYTEVGDNIDCTNSHASIGYAIITRLIQYAEDDAYNICAECGKYYGDKIILGTWVYDICPDCMTAARPELRDEVARIVGSYANKHTIMEIVWDLTKRGHTIYDIINTLTGMDDAKKEIDEKGNEGSGKEATAGTCAQST